MDWTHLCGGLIEGSILHTYLYTVYTKLKKSTYMVTILLTTLRYLCTCEQLSTGIENKEFIALDVVEKTRVEYYTYF